MDPHIRKDRKAGILELAAWRVHARTPAASAPEETLWLAAVIVFPVIALEQFLHTTPAALLALPFYQALHWISDALLALPLAAAAVRIGEVVAQRLRVRWLTVSEVFARACLIAFMFAFLLVPGEALHEEADQLTHSHALLGVHSHTILPPGVTATPLALAGQAAHALTDGIEGQVVGLPVCFAALLSIRRRRQHLTEAAQRS